MSYEKFEKKVRRIKNLEETQELLGWDEEVMMPEKGAEARGEQKSILSSLRHEILISDEMGDLLRSAKDEVETADHDKQAVIREIERERERAAKVPSELVSKITEKTTESVEAWREAKEEDDFESFAPHLKELVELKREYAEHIDPEKEPYRVLFRDYEPYLSYDRMEEILLNLREGVQKILEKIEESDADLNSEALKGDYSDEEQMKLNRQVVERLGYDFERGRIDVSSHPFTSGSSFDARITTWHNSEDLSKVLLPTIHECGHALYQQGLPRQNYGTPLGDSRELSIHESQSRFWENHMARSEEFWRYLASEDEIGEILGDVDVEDVYEKVNRVYPDNLIRVEADELTYHLHIVLRFEIGRDLINGDIEVHELPEVWDRKMEQYLDISPDTDAEGVLQDIHWAWGNFGYFPTYSLGSMVSAQIDSKMKTDIEEFDQKVENGQFEPILNWLRENIHQHGQRYRTEELVEKATGARPSADAFLRYAEDKYGELYGF